MSAITTVPPQAQAAAEPAVTEPKAAPAAGAPPTAAAPVPSTTPATPPAPAAGPEPVEAVTQDDITNAALSGRLDDVPRLKALFNAQKEAAAAKKEGATRRGGEGVTEPEPEPAPTPESEPAATDEPTPEPEPEPEAGDTPPAPDPDDEPEDKPPKRVRIEHLSPGDKAAQIAIHALTKGGMTLLDATRRVLGDISSPAPGDHGEPPEGGTPNGANAATAAVNVPQTAELDELAAKVQDLKAQLEEESVGESFTPEVRRLTEELGEAQAEFSAAKRDAKRNAEQQQRDAQTMTQSWESSKATAAEKFPAVADKKSELYQLSRDLSLAAADPRHPEHQHATSATAPEYFAEKAAKILKIAPRATGKTAATTPPAKAAAPAVVPSPTSAPPAVRPVSGSRGSAPPPAPKTAKQIAEEKTAAADAALRGIPTGAPRRARGGVIFR